MRASTGPPGQLLPTCAASWAGIGGGGVVSPRPPGAPPRRQTVGHRQRRILRCDQLRRARQRHWQRLRRRQHRHGPLRRSDGLRYRAPREDRRLGASCRPRNDDDAAKLPESTTPSSKRTAASRRPDGSIASSPFPEWRTVAAAPAPPRSMRSPHSRRGSSAGSHRKPSPHRTRATDAWIARCRCAPIRRSPVTRDRDASMTRRTSPASPASRGSRPRIGLVRLPRQYLDDGDRIGL